MPDSIGRIKGAAFREFVGFCEQRLGRDSVQRAVDRLDPSVRAPFDREREAFGIVASTWYPAEVVHALLDELIRGRSAEERAALARDGSRQTLEATLRGIYRTLFAVLATPERYARHAGKLWSAYYESGALEVTATTAHGASSRIVGWRAHHPFLCELNAASPAIIYEAMGCAGAQSSRVACVDHGDPCCAFETTWR
jgi:hypothetical protein